MLLENKVAVIYAAGGPIGGADLFDGQHLVRRDCGLDSLRECERATRVA